MLARLVVVPEPAEQTRLQSADVRRDQMDDAARNKKPPEGGERRDRIDQVLDRVVERDGVEARRRKIEAFEAAGSHAQAASAGLIRCERGNLDTFDVPTRG